MPHLSTWFLSLTLLSCACDSGAPAPKAEATKTPAPLPEPTKPAPTTSSRPDPRDEASLATPGRIDPELARTLVTAQGLEKIKLEAQADGQLRDLAIYHRDPAVIPEPVSKQVEVHFPGSKILRYESEFGVAQGRVFEVEVETRDQQKCEFSAKPDGTLLYTECEIDTKALPEGMKAALDKTFPGALLKEAEKTTTPGRGDEYSVELEAAGRVHELYFRADGTIIRHELVVPATFEIEMPVP